MTYPNDPVPTFQDAPSMATPVDSANLNEDSIAIQQIQTFLPSLQLYIPFTALQGASSITIAANTYALVSTASNSVTANFPVAPPNNTIVGMKMVVMSGTNTVTGQLGGSDHFDTSTGSQTTTLSLLNQSGTWQYNSSTSVWVKVSDNLSLTQLKTVFVQPSALNSSYSSGGQWASNVYSTQFENMGRELVTSPVAMTSSTHTFLVLLGLCPASTYSSFSLYVAATAASVTLTAALYSASTLTNTSWARLGSGNVTPNVSTGGLTSTSLAFTLSSPAYVALEMVLTSGSNLPSFGGIPAGASGFINPGTGCPVLGTLNSSSAPASTLNPTTGFTAGAQKIWCALT